ncbi:BREX-1 system adenine-specific DNA-methyltransferase PglX [Rhodococcus pyridinivorans]|uniref:BREX-1 system adenine-specific DNA-methyltransferase PglX n=1 Tax=Rhodococcus pyridinivorans TaxID=103816 RepID=UPI000BA1E9F3|nr:BREX-1 system adenine-specific DNA-methyltransferase PglX [Rhodococcus pyridinivorans]
MDTKPLESFAKAARRELIVAVEARVSAVLAAGSVARSERADTVRLLESEIGDHGREHVVDRVAYTWFNRLVALRFMDARGYTDAGVVSPASGHAHGQPEILADAKRGDLDTAVVTNASAKNAIIGLLDGSRRSTDAEGEAYALLLTEYCRHWYKTMPFMFEAEGAYTELLVPAGLLADGALLSRVCDVLTEDVCNDVEVIGWLYQFYISDRKAEVFAGFKKGKKAGVDEIPAATQLFTPHWIVRYLLENSLGRLWMLNRPASRLVDQMDFYIAPVDEETDFLKLSGPEELTVIDPACGSGHMLTYAFDLLYAIYEEEGYAPSEIPGLILTRNLHGTEIDPRAGALASFALTMKARGKDRRFLSRSGVQPRICVIEPISFALDELDLLVTNGGDRDAEAAFWNQFRDADVLGSLIQPDADETKQAATVVNGLKHLEDTLYYDTLVRARKAVAQAEALTEKYLVAIANPPYMDARNMGIALYGHVSEKYPAGATGLDLTFVLRARSLVQPRGYLGFLNMDSWLGNVECAGFRDVVRGSLMPRTVLHLGPRAFPEVKGEVVQVSATVFEQVAPGSRVSMFMCATGGTTAEAKIAQFHDVSRRYLHTLDRFDVFPGRVFTPYAASDEAHQMFASAPKMNEIAEVRTGLQTGDNVRFLRQWFEVSFDKLRLNDGPGSKARWVPYVKSSSPTRWFAREDLVVDWQNDGAEIRQHPSSVVRNSTYYFQSGLSYGGLAGNLKARLVQEGAIFDQKNSMVFPVGEATTRQLIALMNSPAFELLARLVSPKGFGVGTLAQLPIPQQVLSTSRVEAIADRAIELARLQFDRSETSRGFVGLDSLFMTTDISTDLRLNVESTEKLAAGLQAELRNLELENAAIFRGALLHTNIDDSAAETVEPPNPEISIMQDLASYAVGCMFGRYSLDKSGLILADQGATIQDYLAKVVATGSATDVTFMPDADNVIPFVDDGWFEDDVVEQFRRFLKFAFGAERFEENVRFVEESLGVKTLRDYFITKSGRSKFYDDHVKRYKKRPIYWMFSSPKGSFNALIYLHRYTPSTVSTVLNEYLREYENKLQKALERTEAAAAGGASESVKAGETDSVRRSV